MVVSGQEVSYMELPEARTYPTLLNELVASQPEKTALIDSRGSERTFDALRERATEIAAGLQQQGIGSGDKVALLMENRVEWVETMFGVHLLGATLVGVSTFGQKREISYYLSHSGADAVIAVDSFLGNDYVEVLDDLLGFRDETPGKLEPPDHPELDTVVFLSDEPIEGAIDFDDLDGSVETLPVDPNEPEDTALLLYTSGSTSRPKGVPLLHEGVIENGYHIGERMHLGPSDRAWLGSPLFWSFGSANSLSALFTHHGSLVLQAPFDPDVAVELVDRHECTVYYGLANMARQIVNSDAFDPARIHFRTGITIGSPEDVQFTIDELGVPELCNVYGLTEGYGNTAVADAKLDRDVRIHTAGQALPGQQIVIKNPDTGEKLPAGEVGEVCIGGRITPGYHDDPEKNEAAFDDERYLHTGDLGLLDENGYFQYRGRLKSLIKTGGINVSPVEVEEHLLEHPAIDQAYIIALDDLEMDEIIGAVIVPKSDENLTEEEVREHASKLASYKRPKRIAFADVDDLPTTDTGKTKKLELDQFFKE